MKPCVFCLTFLLFPSGNASAGVDPPFAFESVASVDEMVTLVRSRFPLGTPRAAVRQTFVERGRATLIVRADDPNVEKYLYDINLCQYYIWRWNISADYGNGYKLRQLYVNGNIVHSDGTPMKMIPKVAESGKKASIYKVTRPRPEALKGERSLSFLLFDRDSNPATTHDQAVLGAGPSRADPLNMGTRITYNDVDPWRSIFDHDPANRIVPYRGDCAEVDRQMQSRMR